MRHYVVSAFICWLGILANNHLLAKPPEQGVEQKKTSDSALLWKILRDGQEEGYLFGTIHLGNPELSPVIKTVKGHIKNSETLCLELELNASTMMAVAQGMMLPNNQRVHNIVGPDTYQQLSKAMKQRGISEGQFGRLKPWAVATTLVMATEEKNALAMDQQLYVYALKEQRKICALENIDAQLAIFDGFTLEEQVQMLKETIELVDRTDRPLKPLLDAYLSEDLSAIEQVNETYNEDMTPEMKKKFNELALINRNKKMLTAIELELEKTQGLVTVAVGALHLVGDEGLVLGLKNKGFTLMPVTIF